MPPYIINQSSRVIRASYDIGDPGAGSNSFATLMAPNTHIDLCDLLPSNGFSFICDMLGQPQITVELWLEDYHYKKTFNLDPGARIEAVDNNTSPSAVDICYIWSSSEESSESSEFIGTIYPDRH